MDKTEKPNEKDREEQEDFWLTLEPLPVPNPEKPRRMRTKAAA